VPIGASIGHIGLEALERDALDALGQVLGGDEQPLADLVHAEVEQHARVLAQIEAPTLLRVVRMVPTMATGAMQP
jgi:hypothetical protein